MPRQSRRPCRSYGWRFVLRVPLPSTHSRWQSSCVAAAPSGRVPSCRLRDRLAPHGVGRLYRFERVERLERRPQCRLAHTLGGLANELVDHRLEVARARIRGELTLCTRAFRENLERILHFLAGT